MDQNEHNRELETEAHHRCCGAVISVGAYGDWYLCEACDVTAIRPKRRRLFAGRASCSGD